jgi:hypothetical protein
VSVAFWIVLGVVVAAVYATVLVLILVRSTRRRAARRPYRVPATVLRAHLDDDARLELDLAVAWPGEPVITTTVVELTTARPIVPPFTSGMAVSVFAPPDRSWYRLDWSQFDDLTAEPSGVAGGAITLVPKGSRSKAAAESSDWQVTCKTCGFTRSVWSMGGLRYQAVGDATQGVHCPICDRFRSHLVWRPRPPEPAAPTVVD